LKNLDLGRKSIIIGLGKTGLSVAKYFSAKGLPFDLMDTRSSPPMIEEFKTHFPDIKIEVGKLKESSLLGAKELIVSPGLSIKTPEIQRAKDFGIPVRGDIDIFSKAVKAPIIGVTGSNGKSTVVALLASILTLAGIVLLRPFMANNSIARIIIVLSIAGSILFLPSIGMYYGFHNWTSSLTNGVVDAKFIAIINTALESPLGQVSMIPLLAWIAKNAPSHLKATFFAVFASFTNLALSASALLTKYLNQIFVVTREVKDKVSGEIQTTADYSELGILLIVVTILTLVLPILFVFIINNSKYKTSE